jgi:hypothetical protein
MSQALIIRYTEEGAELECFHSFPDDYDDFDKNYSISYPKLIWQALSTIQLEVRRAMNTAKGSSGLYGQQRRKISLSQEIWSYVSKFISDRACCTLKEGTKTTFFHDLGPFMKVKKRKVQLGTKCIEFRSESDLIVLGCLLGEAVSMGSASKRPKLSMREVQVEVNDSINVLTASEDTADRPPSSAVVFVYDGHYLEIRLSFTKFAVTDIYIGSWCRNIARVVALLRGSTVAAIVATANSEGAHDKELASGTGEPPPANTDLDFLIHGAPFRHNGISYHVTEIQMVGSDEVNNDTIVRAKSYSTGSIILIDAGTVARLIRERLNM